MDNLSGGLYLDRHEYREMAMTFDLEDAIRRANEAYFASKGVGIPESIKRPARCTDRGWCDDEYACTKAGRCLRASPEQEAKYWEYWDEIDEEPADQYEDDPKPERDLDRELDDPRHNQAEGLNKLRYQP